MYDYWELRKIFKFSKVVSTFQNDTDSVVEIDFEGRKIKLKPNTVMPLRSENLEDEYIIPNGDIIYCSNNKISKCDFDEDFKQINLRFRNAINRGQIIEVIQFLNYHYKSTKKGKKFLLFVKHFILSKEPKIDKEIEAWIKTAEENRKRKLYLIGLLLLIIATSLIWIFCCIDKILIIGAIIGALLTQIGKLVDKVIP